MTKEEILKEFDEYFCKTYPDGSSRFLRSVSEDSDKEIKQFISNSLDQYLTEILEELRPEEINDGIEWFKKAQKRYEEDRKYWGNDADRGEMLAASDAASIEHGHNEAVREINAKIDKILTK